MHFYHSTASCVLSLLNRMLISCTKFVHFNNNVMQLFRLDIFTCNEPRVHTWFSVVHSSEELPQNAADVKAKLAAEQNKAAIAARSNSETDTLVTARLFADAALWKQSNHQTRRKGQSLRKMNKLLQTIPWRSVLNLSSRHQWCPWLTHSKNTQQQKRLFQHPVPIHW